MEISRLIVKIYEPALLYTDSVPHTKDVQGISAGVSRIKHVNGT
jgi:hypothetical protein